MKRESVANDARSHFYSSTDIEEERGGIHLFPLLTAHTHIVIGPNSHACKQNGGERGDFRIFAGLFSRGPQWKRTE